MSDYNAEEIASHFDDFGDQEWQRLVKTPSAEVSLHIHTHYLQQTITPGMRVLEIGAGAGRFTQVLADIGARIVVADISPRQIELNQHYADKLGFAHAVEAWQVLDMCAMPDLADASFDAVVAYGGPFSYVLDRRDIALAECLRVLKPGGALLLSVMTVWGSCHSALAGVLSLPPQNNRVITTTGDLIPQTMPGRSSHMHMFRAKELRTWLESTGVSIETLSACGVLSTGWDAWLTEHARNNAATWNELLRMELEASREPGALDLGTHLIAVGRKAL